MASLMELVERVNKGELIEPELLEVYQESSNSAEKFLSHHAQALLDLRRAQQHMLQSLEAIDYGDQKVLSQFVSVSGFLGLTELRAQPMVKFGATAIARREFSLGLEAIQNSIAFDLQNGETFSSDRDNCTFVASQYERVAQCAGWTAASPINWDNKLTRIAYVTSGIADDEASGRTLANFAKHHDSKRYKLQVYSTECGVRRDKQQFAQASYVNGSIKRGTATLESLRNRKISTWIAPTDCETITSAKALADQLIKDQIDIVIFDATQADPIAAVVASWEVGRVKINLCRQTPLYSPGVRTIVYFDQSRWEADKDFWSKRNVDSRYILEGCDAEELLGPPPQRSAYGIPEAAVVLATAGTDLDTTLSTEFVDTVISILRTHPQTIYLLAGDADLSWQKRKFESAGVGKRIGYAGKRKDLPGFLRIADIYLAEFPGSESAGVLQAMCAEKPIVAMRSGETAGQSQAAALAGNECTLPGKEPATYVERVGKIIRDQNLRQRLGKSMRQRVDQHFLFSQTAKHIEQICDQLVKPKIEPQTTTSTTTSPATNGEARGPFAEDLVTLAEVA